MGGPYTGGGGGLLPGHGPGGSQTQAMMRMFDMSASNGGQGPNGGYPASARPSQAVSPGDPPGLVSAASPASPLSSPRSPRAASPPPFQPHQRLQQ